MRKNICVLGSTGSVGTQTLEVAKDLKINVDALVANKNINLLEKQVRIFKPKSVAVFDEKSALTLKNNINDTSTKVFSGLEGVCEVTFKSSADMAVVAISGISGLLPTAEAINSKKDIALANKETLVAGGKIIKKIAKENGVSILPVDSEHNAIFQCLQGVKSKTDLKKLILTASGGPFFDKTPKDLKNVSPNQAVKHPTWSMGKKISIDSATMMNKGLEIIEASHLFDVPVENIDVLIHRESIVHSMIELKDNSIIAQMANPSMKIPIQYALTYPLRKKSSVETLNLSKLKSLTFSNPNPYALEAINLCKDAFNKGIEACIILNAANEKAVELFLKGSIRFTDITLVVKIALTKFTYSKVNSIKDIIALDTKIKEEVEKLTKDLKIRGNFK